MILHVTLPDHHLDAESRDVVKLVMGLIATIAANTCFPAASSFSSLLTLG
jgi:hypothetical protein